MLIMNHAVYALSWNKKFQLIPPRTRCNNQGSRAVLFVLIKIKSDAERAAGVTKCEESYARKYRSHVSGSFCEIYTLGNIKVYI